MAGFYPDVPGPQMMYDRDGSAGFSIASGVPSVLSLAALQAGNDDTSSAMFTLPTSATRLVGIIFPELRNLVGYFTAMNTSLGVQDLVETSVDTTTGADGAWTSRGVGVVSGSVSPEYRTAIQTLSVAGIKAIRFTFRNTGSSLTKDIYVMHLYGTIPTASSPDRLRFWHPTLDQELSGAALDFGDFGRGGTIDRTFRIKNNSSSLTAGSIVLGREALTDASPTVVGVITLSQGSGFATTQNIGALVPGEISGICTVRVASTSSTALGLWRQRLTAVAGSWT